jgi:cytochrome c-type biogenesis protein CcmE
MKTRTIIGIILVALFTTILITTQLSDQSYYTDFETARKTGDKVHVVATWVNRDKASYDPEKDLFQLYLQDTLNQVALVHYFDPKPPSLETAEKIVIEGKQEGDIFVADKIFLKCPSKYEDNTLEAETASKMNPASNTLE